MNKKIDIYIKTDKGLKYLASTNSSKTCQDAVNGYFKENEGEEVKAWGSDKKITLESPSQLKALFSKDESKLNELFKLVENIGDIVIYFETKEDFKSFRDKIENEDIAYREINSQFQEVVFDGDNTTEEEVEEILKEFSARNYKLIVQE